MDGTEDSQGVGCEVEIVQTVTQQGGARIAPTETRSRWLENSGDDGAKSWRWMMGTNPPLCRMSYSRMHIVDEQR